MKGERYRHVRSEEVNHLAGLLRDFGTPDSPAVDKAAQLIHLRYHTLFELVPSAPTATWKNATSVVRLISTLHRGLYQAILNNAGAFRRRSDPGGGTVYFGGNDRTGHKPRYTGEAPERIALTLLQAATELIASHNPVVASIQFYLDLSWIHPFYDANGRVGRLVVRSYLHHQGLYVDWPAIDVTHRQFMKKLNDCHDRRATDNEAKQRAFGWLLTYWQKYVTSLDTILDADEGLASIGP